MTNDEKIIMQRRERLLLDTLIEISNKLDECKGKMRLCFKINEDSLKGCPHFQSAESKISEAKTLIESRKAGILN